MNVALPRSVTRRKRHVAHNLDRFGPRGASYPTSCMLRSSGLIRCDYKMMRNLMCMRGEGPCLALYSLGGRVTGQFRERVLVVYV
jgi:hypothetical protein